MADRRYTLLLYTAVITAVVATFGVYRVLEGAKAGSRVATRGIVVAAQDLQEGAILSKENVTIREWPAAAVPDSAYVAPDSVYGRVARMAVFKGEVIVPGRLAPIGTGGGLEVKITPGKRAMAVKIDDVAGISGLIQPNSRVDIVVTLRSGRADEPPVAKLFMENLRVLSVGTTIQRDASGKAIEAATAALEVTPEEAERLAVAANEGSIQLVLRSFADPGSIQTAGARTADVLEQLRSAPSVRAPEPVRRPVARQAPRVQPPPPQPVQQAVPVAPAPRRPDSTSVQIWRGSQTQLQKFEKTDGKAGAPDGAS